MHVSVIIPTYNRADMIGRAVESALCQTYRDLEVIVVDDGSTDATRDAVQPFLGRITYIRQQNGGPSSARNHGIAAARGSVLAFLDSDDLWLPDKIERQVEVLRAGGDAIPCCVCNASVHDAGGRQSTSFGNAGLKTTIDSGYWLNPAPVLATRFLLFNQVVAVRRKALGMVGGFRNDLRLLEDYELALRLSCLGPWGIVCRPLVIKRNETVGIGVQAMNEPAKHFRALEIMLAGFLGNQPIAYPRVAELVRKNLKDVRLHVRAADLADSPQRLASIAGHLWLRALRVRRAVRRRMPNWPQAELTPLRSPSPQAPHNVPAPTSVFKPITPHSNST